PGEQGRAEAEERSECGGAAAIGAAAGARRAGADEPASPRAAAGRVVRRTFLLLALSLATPLFANDLTVDKQTLQLDETLTIVVSLENSFADADDLRIPLQNLELVGPPSVNSQFTWINGTTTKRKIFRFIARPKAPGGALVGPLVVNGADGQRETLPPISVQVLPDAAAGTNDPLAIFRELVATRRDPIFVVAEVDKASAYVGEEIVVTWRIYNAATVREWQLVDLPKLEDFWSEELDVRNEPQQQVALDESVVQKVVVRRVALFPLRSGTLLVAPVGVEALVL